MSEGRRTPERCAGTACGQVCELLGLRASRVHPEEESTCLIPNWFDELCLLSHNLWLSIHIPFSEVQGDVFAIEPYVYHFSLDLGHWIFIFHLMHLQSPAVLRYCTVTGLYFHPLLHFPQ